MSVRACTGREPLTHLEYFITTSPCYNIGDYGARIYRLVSAAPRVAGSSFMTHIDRRRTLDISPARPPARSSAGAQARHLGGEPGRDRARLQPPSLAGGARGETTVCDGRATSAPRVAIGWRSLMIQRWIMTDATPVVGDKTVGSTLLSIIRPLFAQAVIAPRPTAVIRGFVRHQAIASFKICDPAAQSGAHARRTNVVVFVTSSATDKWIVASEQVNESEVGDCRRDASQTWAGQRL